MEKCIDISKHQTSFNANTCKSEGITTVICRLAYATSKDSKCEEYFKSAKSAGLRIGGYGFGTWHYKSKCNGNLDLARSIMIEQVNSWIRIAKENGCNSWVAIDQEVERDQTLGLSIGDNTTLLCEAAKMIEDAGLHPCLYASASWIIAHVNLSKFTYPLWVAYYKWYGTKQNFDTAPEDFPVSGKYGKWMVENKYQICMWQFTSEGYASKYGCTHGSDGLDKNFLYFQPTGNSIESVIDSFDEYFFFPMKTLRVTQGVGFDVDGVKASTYSHKYQSAYDIAGEDTGKSPVFAPFSCKVKRIYNGSSSSSKCNFTWYANTKRVKARNGKVYAPNELVFMTAHCDTSTMNKYGIVVGAEFVQGQICGYEGTAGCSASHCHITVGEGWSGNGWHPIGDKRKGSYEINNPVYLHQLCWLKPDCNVMNTGGYVWKFFDSSYVCKDEPIIEETPVKSPQTSDIASDCSYFAKYNGNSDSIVAALKNIGEDSSYAYRKTIAIANGIDDYKGTASQNLHMVALIKQGKLVRPEKCFKKYTGNSGSIAEALKSIGEDGSYAYRQKIAVANSIMFYRGTVEQNTEMLSLLKKGKLIKP